MASKLNPYADEIIKLRRKENFTLEEIQEWLWRAKGGEGDVGTISRFLKEEVPRQITKCADQSKKRWLKVFNTEVNVMNEVQQSYQKLKSLTDRLEEKMAEADEEQNKRDLDRAIKHFINASKEAREHLSMMVTVFEKVQVFNNYRKFFDIISHAIKKEAPEEIADAIFKRIRKEVSNDNLFNIGR